MPITAKLSKLFYDRFGDQATDELVNWLNTVDASSRAELRELNEINAARFEAKLDANAARFDAKLDQRAAELRADLGGRIDRLDAKVDQRIAEVRADLGARIDKLDAKLDRSLAEQRADLERSLKEHTRWMFLAWITLLIPIIGFGLRK